MKNKKKNNSSNNVGRGNTPMCQWYDDFAFKLNDKTKVRIITSKEQALRCYCDEEKE